MKPVLIIYFSGVGNTKSVAEYIERITEKIPTEIYSIEKLPDKFDFDNYSAVIIGTPTYHSEPAQPLMSFLENLKASRNIPAFLFTTCGLYSENCLRILAKMCIRHRLIPLHCASYRCSATDGMLLVPFMECWFRNEKDLRSNIKKDLGIFLSRLRSRSKPDIPAYKWYAPLNYPNKLLGKNTTFPIYLHEEKCVKCGKCQKDCPVGAISFKDGTPVINKSDCMNCYRCIHHCPSLALSLFKNKPVKRVWTNLLSE